MSDLQNGNFEQDWGSHDVLICRPGQAPVMETRDNIFTPCQWKAWFYHTPDAPQPDRYDQPEVRDAWKSGDPRRVHSGEKGILLFTFWRKHWAGFFQQVQVTPGTHLRFEAWGHAWSNWNEGPHPDDPRWSEGAHVGYEVVALREGTAGLDDADRNFTFSVGIDPTGGTDPFADTVVWGESYHVYNGYCRQLSVEATAKAATVTVFLQSKTLWGYKHNDAYWDDATLVQIADEPPAYECTTLVLPQDATREQLDEILGLALPKRNTICFSNDDSGRLGGKTYLYNIPAAKRQEYLDWYAKLYPRTQVEFASTSDWDDGILLGQCDAPWGPRHYGDGGGPTYCAKGCWLADCAMALRYLGLDAEATPLTVDAAIGPDGYDADYAMTWAAMPRAGLEVLGSTTDADIARAHLDMGYICFAEVLPISLRHFVMVTRYKGDRYWMYDPWKRVAGWLDEKYSGVESWRMIQPAEKPAPTPDVPLIGLHLQAIEPGVFRAMPSRARAMLCGGKLRATARWVKAATPWGLATMQREYQATVEATVGYIATVKPRVTKIFQAENAQAIKAVSPETLVILRYFTDEQNLDGNLEQAAYKYVESFADTVRTHQKWIDGVESYNETVCSKNITSIMRAVEFDYYFPEALNHFELDVFPVLLNVAVGNPYHEGGEIELLLPAVRQAVRYGGALGYHGYWLYNDQVAGPGQDWKYFAGRWQEWDKVFAQHGLQPRYIFGECGAFASCNDGWRSGMCCSGDWELYQAQILEFQRRLVAWNATHGDRALGGTLFTTCPHWMNWESFRLTQTEMEKLARALTA